MHQQLIDATERACSSLNWYLCLCVCVHVQSQEMQPPPPELCLQRSMQLLLNSCCNPLTSDDETGGD